MENLIVNTTTSHDRQKTEVIVLIYIVYLTVFFKTKRTSGITNSSRNLTLSNSHDAGTLKNQNAFTEQLSTCVFFKISRKSCQNSAICDSGALFPVIQLKILFSEFACHVVIKPYRLLFPHKIEIAQSILLLLKLLTGLNTLI